MKTRLTEVAQDAMTWRIFSKNLEEWFCSEGSKKEITLDFLALKEVSMLIAKYKITFTEKA